VRGGVKLRSSDGTIPSTPLSDALLALLADAVPAAEMVEGVKYAKAGQIVSIEVVPGAVRARVQGRRVPAYETTLSFGVFSEDEWTRIVDAMASEAVYLVKLIANELPESVDTLLGRLGLSLLPGPGATIGAECTCPGGGACRHIAAIGHVLAERLVERPVLAFTLRGLEAERLLDRLRQARALQARGVAAAHLDPLPVQSQVEPEPLEECIDGFWRPDPRVHEVQQAPPATHAAHALLRRLGPSPLEGKFPLVGLLASVYDRVAEHAVHVRDRAEGLNGGKGAGD
jgi:uncharacterized Zn finger protein